jgi:gliding motility-associated-like protein
MYFSFRLLRRLIQSSDKVVYTALLILAFSLGATTKSYAQLAANFTMSKDKGCAPLYVTFTNTSTGNQDSCFWDLDINGNTADECNPSAIFNQPGTYNIKLTIYKGSQTSSVTKTITVFKDPVSKFDAAPRTGCVPFNVQFSDQSTIGDAPITNWLWDMGDGRTENTKNPLHTYTFSGNLTVSLIVTDGNGCKNTLTVRDFIKKAIPPTVDFSVNKIQTCLIPFNAVFQSNVTSSTPVSYKWNFGTGDTSSAQNPSYVYNAAGNYNVSLTVRDQNNCTATKSVANAIKVEKFKVNANVPTPICTNETVTPSVNSAYSPIFCNWNFGNGTSSTNTIPTIAYTTPGNYTITLNALNQEGCRDSMTQNVTVNLAPTAAFSADQLKSCVPYTVNFTNTSTNGNSYKWFINGPGGFFATSTNAAPSFYLPQNGNYDVKLVVTAANGCEDVLNIPQYIWIGPDQINATSDKTEGCEDLKVFFHANLTHNWTPTSITWDFGDGTTGTGEDPVHIYTNPGDYNVKVTVTYDAPCQTLTDFVGPIHVGGRYPFNGTFDYDKVCVRKETVTYEATGGIPTTEFIWLYGDGTGSGRNTTHIYQDPSQPRKYLVQLIAINNTCRDTLDIKEIFVAYPKANFNYTSRCNSQSVDFVNLSKGYTSATWDFGDGTILSTMDKNLSHTYAANLTSVTASLVVHNDSTGCTDTIVQTIKFSNVDSFKFNVSTHIGCKPLKVVLTAVEDTNIVAYLWDIGNGTFVFGNNYVANFTNEGKFVVKMFVKYRNGCVLESTQKDTITVLGAKANFNFDKASGCVPAVFSFSDSSIARNSSIATYRWQFHDGSTASGSTATHTYNAMGSFPVKLAVVNAEGCKDSITKNVLVSDVKADFDISVNDVCGGKPIKFINLSSANAATYLWDFGDGTTSTDTFPTHVYSQEKNYTIKLTVTDGKGCVNTMVKPGFVRIKNIHVNFSATPTFKTCPDLISNFQLQAPANLHIKNIMWDFGNGNTSNDNNPRPQGVYTISDSFDVKLVVIDSNNCTDTVYKPNYIIVAGPSGEFNFMPDFGCAPFNVTFNAQFKNTTTTIWDFGNGDTKLDRTLANQVTYTYRREGEFTPTLVLKDDYGCTVNIVSKKKVNVAKLTPFFGVDKTSVCDGSGRVTISDSVYTSPNSPLKDFFWSFTDSTNKVTKGVGDTFIPIRSGQYKVNFFAENTFGCIVKDSVKIGVYTSPVITAVKDKLICKGEQVPLNVIGNPSVIQWTPSNSLNNSNTQNVLAKPDATTQYIIKAYHYPQCPVYDTVEVVVKTLLDARAYPDTIVCIGDTVQLHALAENTSLNTTKITWQNSPTLSSTTNPDPLAFPKTNTTYYAIVENGKCQMQKLPVIVSVKPLPTVKAGEDHIIIKGQEVQIDASSPNQVSYIWSPDYKLSCTQCDMPMASPEVDTFYNVTAVNQFGCKATDRLRIRVIEDCAGKMVFVPNTFTPNGDGQNDILKVFGPGVESVKQVRIFNRWGQMVFETNDPDGIGWDGTFNGEELNPGVFVYYMDVECINGERTIKKGDITLLR